jgi:hypothetical protein
MIPADLDRRRFPAYGWLGLLILLAGQLALLAGHQLAAIWLTPIMWTGYFVLADAALGWVRGHGWLTGYRRDVPLAAMLSILVWLLFEAYNLRMVNWIYKGLPPQAWLRDLGYFWSFATIMPGVFVTADLVRALLKRWRGPERGRLGQRQLGPAWSWFLLGLTLVIIPVLLPPPQAAYLFGAVWIGFVLLLDPLNEALGLPSLRQELRRGRLRPLISYLLAGLICGLLWEAWNLQAARAGGAYWVYTFPAKLRITGLYYGHMPIEGLLGFLPFALELRAFYLLLRSQLGGSRVFGPSPLGDK